MEELDRQRLRRVRHFGAVVAVAIVAILARLVDLQLVRGEVYAVLAEQQRLRPVPVPAPRGRILDRNGLPLATNRPAFTASLVYTGGPLPDAVRERLRQILGIGDAEIDAALRQLRDYPFYPARLKADLSLEELTRLEEHRHLLPGVVVEVIPVRDYPYGSLAAHVLGHVQAGASTGQGVVIGVTGATGLEAAFDGEVRRGGQVLRGLRGEDGREFVEVDARFRPSRSLGRNDPVPGNDLVLTLDARLQAAAEAALAEQLAWLRETRSDPCPCPAPAGAVVALDAQTGAILAMASYPSFNPEDFAVLPFLPRDSARRRELSVRIEALQRDRVRAPMLNRALQAAYPPGSIFKMVTALAGLRQGLGFLRVYDPGFLSYGGRTWHDWRAHGSVDLLKAIGQSCNVFFWTMALRTGLQPILDVARMLGLGEGTGLQDLPGENLGRRPDPLPQNLLPAAIGQGQNQYTPLQMAQYVATLATGVRHRPYLVQEIRDVQGRTLWRAQPEVLSTLDVPPEYLERVREGMRAVVQGGPGWAGTAQWRFRDAPYTSAGKTGTVQRGGSYGSHTNHGWYVAYAPAGPGDEPRIAVAAVVEQGGGGSLAAAPIVRRVLDVYFGAAPSPLDGGRPAGGEAVVEPAGPVPGD